MTSHTRPAPPVAVEATRLLGKWLRVARCQVPAAGSCSCGGFDALAAGAFEQDILAFLHERHSGRHRSIETMLKALARDHRDDATARVLLADLERSLDSFAEAQGPPV